MTIHLKTTFADQPTTQMGVVMPTAGGGGYPLDPVYEHETGTGTTVEVGGPYNIGGNSPPYLDMSPGYATGHDLGQTWQYEVEWVPFNLSLPHYFRDTDPGGVPTSSVRPDWLQPFAVVGVYSSVSPSAGVGFWLARQDDSVVYDSGIRVAPSDGVSALTQTVIYGNVLSSVGFWSDILGAHPMRWAITATGPSDSFWRLYAMGFRYPAITQPRAGGGAAGPAPWTLGRRRG